MGCSVDRVTYQNLRFEVEAQIDVAIRSPGLDQSACVNSLMRVFLAALAQQEVRRQQSRRELITFRRSSSVKVPGWAFHPDRG